MRNFSIDGHTVGDGAPCFVIAEAGVNHNGELTLAHRLIDAAAEARADAVKFQTFVPDDLVSPEAPKAQYQVVQTGGAESQLEMLRRLTLPNEAWHELQRHANERALVFLSTPFDLSSADLLDRLGVAAFKIPSGEVNNHPFLRAIARRSRPVLLSTGMSELEEVAEAVEIIRREGDPPLALLHCTSSYPAPADAANLRAIDTMRARFDVPLGYSDHTLGPNVALAAIARGAALLEKHLTLDRALPGPDHTASMEPRALGELVAAIREIEASLGSGEKTIQRCELDTRNVARRSLFAARNLAADAPLAVQDVAIRRPGTGLPPTRLAQLIGRKLRRNVAAGRMLEDGDFE